MMTLQKVRECFYWNNVWSDVEKCCRTCDPCVALKGSRKRTRRRLQLYNVGAPFERIQFDIIVPIPISSDGNNIILSWITLLSGLKPILFPTKRPQLLQRFWFNTGYHDSGSLYNCTPIKGETSILQLARDCVKYSPSTKRGQQLCILSLRHGREIQSDHPEKPLSPGLQSAVHETTGYSPSQTLFGRDLRLPADLLFSRPPDAPLAPEEYIEKLQARMEEMHHLARERTGMASEKMKTRYDARATGHDFREGDKVWLWNPKRRKGLSLKLQTN
ncbi:retrovirus-related Pol polyprotein from transposon 412 [Trichonephila clavipes]|nr:retrovirus-related Pol polyprotein from transposon 412 [Trichonephila clavipes]